MTLSPYGRRLLAVAVSLVAGLLMIALAYISWDAARTRKGGAVIVTASQEVAAPSTPAPAPLLVDSVTAPSPPAVKRESELTPDEEREWTSLAGKPLDSEKADAPAIGSEAIATARLAAVVATGLTKRIGGKLFYCSRNPDERTDTVPDPQNIIPCAMPKGPTDRSAPATPIGVAS